MCSLVHGDELSDEQSSETERKKLEYVQYVKLRNKYVDKIEKTEIIWENIR